MSSVHEGIYDEFMEETISDGFVRIDLERTYQVFLDGGATATAARNRAIVPKIGTVMLLSTGEKLWVVKVTPRRVDREATRSKWHVDIVATNATNEFPRDQNGNPVSDPTQAVKDVDISFLEFQEDVTTAKLDSITSGGPTFGGGNNMNVPPWLAKQKTKAGPITNSAGVAQDVQKPSFRKQITVSQWIANWDSSLDDYIGKINSDEITIVQRDSQGPKLTQSFAAGTLLMNDIVKEDHWKDGILYFRRRFVMSYNPQTWRHAELDQGTKRFIKSDVQFKPDGDKYTDSDLTDLGIEGDWGYQEITTKDSEGNFVAIGEPVRFNGWGSNAPNSKTETYDDDVAHFLNYNIFETKAFTPLGL